MQVAMEHAVNARPFSVIGAESVKKVLSDHYEQLYELIAATYHDHQSGDTINPDSYFLLYPNAPKKRIIALPAHLGGEKNVSGIKWIASNPDNIQRGLQRASAVLILNDGVTGFPIACLESGIISATRTVISALFALFHMNGQSKKVKKLGIIGNGFIARNFVDALNKLSWDLEEIQLYDLNREDSEKLAAHIKSIDLSDAAVSGGLDELLTECDVIVTTTTVPKPYIHNIDLLKHNPLILNISLRDIDPDIILQSHNIVDDVDHCLKANTSPHLAFQKAGHHRFIDGSVSQLAKGEITITHDKPVIFSPFGLGVLDVALGFFIYETVQNASQDYSGSVSLPDFFGDLSRWC